MPDMPLNARISHAQSLFAQAPLLLENEDLSAPEIRLIKDICITTLAYIQELPAVVARNTLWIAALPDTAESARAATRQTHNILNRWNA